MSMILSNEQQNAIYSVIAGSEAPIKAKQIADLLGLSRGDVNSYLYSNLDTYARDEQYRWSIIRNWDAPKVVCTNGTDDKLFRISNLKKLNNKEGARIFSQEEFDSLADWSYGRTKSGKEPVDVYTTRTGNVIECDSSYEKKLLEHFESHDLVLEMGGQSLDIGYESDFKRGSYYPDVFIYTVTHHIAVIEVKTIAFMAKHTNIEKYRSLGKYCKERGFMYMMVDPTRDYMTFEEYREENVVPCIIDIFDELQENLPEDEDEPIFTTEDVKRWYDEQGKFAGISYTEFVLQVKSMVAYLGWFSQRGSELAVYRKPVKWEGFD